jgi:hypothetical protein
MGNLPLNHAAQCQDATFGIGNHAMAARGRPAASSSIALRKQAIARSAVRASTVGGMFSYSVLNGCR